MGSDGLFDNVYDRDIEMTLSIFGGSDHESAQRSGKFLVRTSRLTVHGIIRASELQQNDARL